MSLYASTNTVQAYLNEKLIESQRKLDKFMFIVEDFNTALLDTDRQIRPSDEQAWFIWQLY